MQNLHLIHLPMENHRRRPEQLVQNSPSRGAARGFTITSRDALPLKHFSYVFPFGTVYSVLVLPFE